MTSSANLTILLPLKDRVPFTQRWLAYAASARLPYRILIADGGADDAVAQTVAENKSQGLDVDYVRYPFDRTYADYYAKLADALSRVTTPFVVMADNDDLFIPRGWRAPWSSCWRTPSTWRAAGNARCSGSRARDRHRRPTRCTATASSGSAAASFRPTSPTPPRRACASAASAPTTCSTPCTAPSLLRRHFEAVRDCNPRDLFLMEQLVMFLTAIAGKTRQLDTLYIARQQDSPGSSGGAHQDRFGDWYDRMLLPTWSEDFTRFVDCAAAALSARRRHLRRGGTPDRRRVLQDVGGAVAARRPGRGADRVVVDAAGAAGGPRVWSTCRARACFAAWRWRAIGTRDGSRTISSTAPNSGPGAPARPRGNSRRCERS